MEEKKKDENERGKKAPKCNKLQKMKGKQTVQEWRKKIRRKVKTQQWKLKRKRHETKKEEKSFDKI